MKRHRQAVKHHVKFYKLPHICVSQYYNWNVMVDTDWEDMKYANSPCKFLIFLLINFSSVWIKFIYFVMRGN